MTTKPEHDNAVVDSFAKIAAEMSGSQSKWTAPLIDMIDDWSHRIEALAASHCAQGSSQQVVRGEAVGEVVRAGAGRLDVQWNTKFVPHLGMRIYTAPPTERSDVETRSGSNSQPADKPAGQAVTDAPEPEFRDAALYLRWALGVMDEHGLEEWSQRVQVIHREATDYLMSRQALAPEPATAGERNSRAWKVLAAVTSGESRAALDSVFGELYYLLAENRRLREATPAAAVPDQLLDEAHARGFRDGVMRANERSAAVPDGWRDFIRGMSVSVDVSTNDDDAGNRIFGTITEVMDDRESKHGVILLVQDNVTANFAAAPANRPADAKRGVPAKWDGDDVEKAVHVLTVLHTDSAATCEQDGRADLAGVHRDAVTLLEYTLELHRKDQTTIATPPADPILSQSSGCVSNGSTASEVSP